MTDGPADLVRFAVGLLVVAGLTVALARWAKVGLGWEPLVVLARAVVQLGALALLLRGVLSAPWTVVAFLALMATTASVTAGGRLRRLRHGRRIALLGVVTGASVAIALVLGLRLVELEVRNVVAVAGIVVGSAMTAATLSGRRFLLDASQRRDELEAWLALGATPAQAHEDVGRRAVRESLLPNLDQTRSTGLVTLPGAFVGALFGGADPLEAARFQLAVLAGLGLTMLVTAVVVTRLAGRTPFLLPAEQLER